MRSDFTFRNQSIHFGYRRPLRLNAFAHPLDSPNDIDDTPSSTSRSLFHISSRCIFPSLSPLQSLCGSGTGGDGIVELISGSSRCSAVSPWRLESTYIHGAALEDVIAAQSPLIHTVEWDVALENPSYEQPPECLAAQQLHPVEALFPSSPRDILSTGYSTPRDVKLSHFVATQWEEHSACLAKWRSEPCDTLPHISEPFEDEGETHLTAQLPPDFPQLLQTAANAFVVRCEEAGLIVVWQSLNAEALDRYFMTQNLSTVGARPEIFDVPARTPCSSAPCDDSPSDISGSVAVESSSICVEQHVGNSAPLLPLPPSISLDSGVDCIEISCEFFRACTKAWSPTGLVDDNESEDRQTTMGVSPRPATDDDFPPEAEASSSNLISLVKALPPPLDDTDNVVRVASNLLQDMNLNYFDKLREEPSALVPYDVSLLDFPVVPLLPDAMLAAGNVLPLESSQVALRNITRPEEDSIDINTIRFALTGRRICQCVKNFNDKPIIPCIDNDTLMIDDDEFEDEVETVDNNNFFVQDSIIQTVLWLCNACNITPEECVVKLPYLCSIASDAVAMNCSDSESPTGFTDRTLSDILQCAWNLIQLQNPHPHPHHLSALPDQQGNSFYTCDWDSAADKKALCVASVPFVSPHANAGTTRGILEFLSPYASCRDAILRWVRSICNLVSIERQVQRVRDCSILNIVMIGSEQDELESLRHQCAAMQHESSRSGILIDFSVIDFSAEVPFLLFARRNGHSTAQLLCLLPSALSARDAVNSQLHLALVEAISSQAHLSIIGLLNSLDVVPPLCSALPNCTTLRWCLFISPPLLQHLRSATHSPQENIEPLQFLSGVVLVDHLDSALSANHTPWSDGAPEHVHSADNRIRILLASSWLDLRKSFVHCVSPFLQERHRALVASSAAGDDLNSVQMLWHFCFMADLSSTNLHWLHETLMPALREILLTMMQRTLHTEPLLSLQQYDELSFGISVCDACKLYLDALCCDGPMYALQLAMLSRPSGQPCPSQLAAVLTILRDSAFHYNKVLQTETLICPALAWRTKWLKDSVVPRLEPGCVAVLLFRDPVRAAIFSTFLPFVSNECKLTFVAASLGREGLDLYCEGKQVVHNALASSAANKRCVTTLAIIHCCDGTTPRRLLMSELVALRAQTAQWFGTSRIDHTYLVVDAAPNLLSCVTSFTEELNELCSMWECYSVVPLSVTTAIEHSAGAGSETLTSNVEVACESHQRTMLVCTRYAMTRASTLLENLDSKFTLIEAYDADAPFAVADDGLVFSFFFASVVGHVRTLHAVVIIDALILASLHPSDSGGNEDNRGTEGQLAQLFGACVPHPLQHSSTWQHYALHIVLETASLAKCVETQVVEIITAWCRDSDITFHISADAHESAIVVESITTSAPGKTVAAPYNYSAAIFARHEDSTGVHQFAQCASRILLGAALLL